MLETKKDDDGTCLQPNTLQQYILKKVCRGDHSLWFCYSHQSCIVFSFMQIITVPLQFLGIWKHCCFMMHGNGPHDGCKASTAALQMGPVLLAAFGLYEDNWVGNDPSDGP